MKKISFDGIGAVVATFETAEGVTGGQVVKVTKNGQVGPCTAGDCFAGVALTPREGLAAVQVRGFCTVNGSKLALGAASLAADGKGGVQPAAEGEAGVPALVVSLEADGRAVLCL